MTDNEIIKALECLKGVDVMCLGCSYQKYGYPMCREYAATDALDLINRQKAEIERLKFPKFVVENTLSEKEISEMLKMGRVGVVPHIEYSIKRIDEDGIRAEAINDYIKRLTDSDRYGWYDWDIKECVYTKTDIINLAKEMVGE